MDGKVLRRDGEERTCPCSLDGRVLRLLDWLLTLPPEMKLAYRERVLEYEKTNAMPFMSVFETVSREEGRAAGAKSMVARLLRKKFGEISQATSEAVDTLSVTALEDLSVDLLDFHELADLKSWLQSHTA